MRSAGGASGGAGAATGAPASGRRLRLRLPTAPAVRGGAQRAGRRLGVVGVGDRAHDDDPPRPRRDHRADRAGPPAPPGRGAGPRVGNPGPDRGGGAYAIGSPPIAGRPSLVGVAWTGPTAM